MEAVFAQHAPDLYCAVLSLLRTSGPCSAERRSSVFGPMNLRFATTVDGR